MKMKQAMLAMLLLAWCALLSGIFWWLSII